MNSPIKLFFTVVIIFGVLASFGYFFFFKGSSLTSDSVASNVGRGNCGLTVESPVENEKISFPFSVHVTVDHSPEVTKDCMWVTSNKQAGIVTITNNVGTQIISAPLITAQDASKQNIVSYTAHIAMSQNTNLRAHGVIWMIFTDEGIGSSAHTFKLRLNAF